ncbi:hemolysin III family protein [Lentibacter algarum]|uniref:PAQR family membrane homeostasis protein TrhA n=1 Tax=Lentibacter algarum TaxID=576131 RepID=UPI001C071221|nr:hemolysin III family protein [Lentibacter algarum]MBU2981223.1 hemolysin III family protein [Lentibacter algarum]
MTETNYPSPVQAHRYADIAVHLAGLSLIILASGLLIWRALGQVETALSVALLAYVGCALASNLASWAYHFAPWHGQRKLLRRIDHAAIYPSITGTFTPFFVFANTTWTITLLWLCWGLTALAIYNKITNAEVKSRWSTASYLALGALGLSALPDLNNVPPQVLWWVVAGAVSYVIGVTFYARKAMPYRYAIWHTWVNIGGVMMFIGIWRAVL